MAPTHSRQLLVWTLPTVAALLSYLWFKRKRFGAQSDPGENNSSVAANEQILHKEKSLAVDIKESVDEADAANSLPSTPNKSFSRSLSGVESTPIDIIIPPELRATKSTARIVSDEDLDIEIEKIKSMKNGGALFPIKPVSPTHLKSKTTIRELNKSSKKKISKKESGKMAQKDITIVEEKLTSLKVNKNKEEHKKRDYSKNSKNNKNKENEELHRQNNERDSANHSPSDVMLASPSLSSISDNHSEGSSDSGKGGSDVATPPPSRIPGINASAANVSILYDFILPQSLVGKLIGRHGSFVTQIKDKTNAMIIVRSHPTNSKMKICSVEGTNSEIDNALKMIRDKFPLKRYPDVTLETVDLPPKFPIVSLIPDHLYLKLIEGINNDTVLSCLVAPNHLFLQQPTHPSYPSLNVLTNCMNACYSQAESPLLPTPITENTVCAAYSVHAWYRAMVLSSDEESDTSYVKFLDYGGFAYVENSKLRQIRGDFMLLPFQAAECMLANVTSLNDDCTWPEEAYNLIAEVAKGSIMYTQVADYTEDGVPLVLIYVVVGPQNVIFLNQHLVDNGFAEWVVPPVDDLQSNNAHQQETTEGAVGGVQQA